MAVLRANTSQNIMGRPRKATTKASAREIRYRDTDTRGTAIRVRPQTANAAKYRT